MEEAYVFWICCSLRRNSTPICLKHLKETYLNCVLFLLDSDLSSTALNNIKVYSRLDENISTDKKSKEKAHLIAAVRSKVFVLNVTQ